MNFDSTIAAISTPLGTGGIAIVRMSGDKSIEIADKLFKGKKSLLKVKSHTIHYGNIVSPEGFVIDEVMVSVMKAPNTYTREDVVEINCHGSVYGARKVLEELIKSGATLAEGGEFTKRAFLNGRIDLTKAEAVIDIINSRTSSAHTLGVNQLGGVLSQKINEIREDLLSLTSHLQALLDFPEEGLEPFGEDEYYNILKNTQQNISHLIETSDKGRIIRDGIETVICGKPNVGKSSLLNLLSGTDRAIVTEIEGTTRDSIEEYVYMDDVALKVIDTAGIRETGDTVEKIGVEKSKKLIGEASLVIFILDALTPPDENDRLIGELVSDKKTIVLINKSEKEINPDTKEFASGFENVIEFSVKEEKGVKELTHKIKSLFELGELNGENKEAIINLRHKEALYKAQKAVSGAIDTLDMGMSADMTFIDVENAISYLGEITGLTVSEEIVDGIFHKFCVGK